MLSNLPFYLTLLPLFLEASVPRVEVGWGGLVCGWGAEWCSPHSAPSVVCMRDVSLWEGVLPPCPTSPDPTTPRLPLL